MKGVSGNLPERDELVLAALLRGMPKTAIARAIGISASLVSYSIRRIFAARGVKNLVELGAWAQRNGLMQDER